mmetsp:Transcript_75856/g.245645  ORF Transcript_75856/g.245645 Transcript_75856/m.245645 type:complete len:342 (+) Transcript_75856:679-1704(+)
MRRSCGLLVLLEVLAQLLGLRLAPFWNSHCSWIGERVNLLQTLPKSSQLWRAELCIGQLLQRLAPEHLSILVEHDVGRSDARCVGDDRHLLQKDGGDGRGVSDGSVLYQPCHGPRAKRQGGDLCKGEWALELLRGRLQVGADARGTRLAIGCGRLPCSVLLGQATVVRVEAVHDGHIRIQLRLVGLGGSAFVHEGFPAPLEFRGDGAVVVPREVVVVIDHAGVATLQRRWRWCMRLCASSQRPPAFRAEPACRGRRGRRGLIAVVVVVALEFCDHLLQRRVLLRRLRITWGPSIVLCWQVAALRQLILLLLPLVALLYKAPVRQSALRTQLLGWRGRRDVR